MLFIKRFRLPFSGPIRNFGIINFVCEEYTIVYKSRIFTDFEIPEI